MRVASLSFWHLHGPDYVRDVLDDPDFELVGLWDDDETRGREGAAEHGIAYLSSLDEVLADPGIDGVIVCTETSRHLEIVRRAIAAGKHVFVEKVLAADLAGAEALAQEARLAGVTLTVSMWRSDRGYTPQIVELLKGGAVGQVTSVRIRDGHPLALPMPGRPGGALPERFYDPATAQGGVLIDLCHPLYLMAQFIGLPERVVGTLGHVASRAVEDNAAVLLSYADGAIGVVETSSSSSMTPFTIEIHGTEGSLLYSEPGIGALVDARRNGSPDLSTPDDEARLRVRSVRGAESGWRSLAVREDPPSALQRWRRLALAGEQDTDNIERALALTALVESAYRSAADGRVQSVRTSWLTQPHA